MNRDFITASQPETRAIRDVLIATQPLVMLDEHGYTGTTLIEPATAPHGQNYDYDLYIKHAYPNALGMEQAIVQLGHPETSRADIPFRDYAPGDWDDWPPIFTPMYAIYHGAVGHTVEIPLQVNRTAYTSLPVEELRRRSAINTDVAEATMRGRDHLHRHQPGQPDRGPDRAVPPRLGRRAATHHPGRVRARIRPRGPVRHRVPAGVRHPGRGCPALRRRGGPARRPPRRQRRPGRTGEARLHPERPSVPRRLLSGRPAPAQARPGQRAPGGRRGHLRQGAADVRHLRLEPPVALGRHGRHQQAGRAAGIDHAGHGGRPDRRGHAPRPGRTWPSRSSTARTCRRSTPCSTGASGCTSRPMAR